MNLILNRDFKMPADGWYQFAPMGEFPHAGADVIQIVDSEACTAMSARFKADAAVANFAGLLIDFDHFSMDGSQRSEAAGWVTDMESRDTGLWGKIRWSDIGEAAVKGGRYRFLSPVWARSDCVDLGPSTGSAGSPQAGSGQVAARIRPVRMINAALTNDPNLKGLRPLSNSGQSAVSSGQFRTIGERAQQKGNDMKAVIEKLVNHLGLAADATEAVILEKMGALISATVVTELQNSLSALQTKHDGLVANLKTVEDELVNRHLADYEGLINEGSKPFWAQQLIQNRVGALAVLGDLREMAGNTVAAPDTSKGGNKETTRKPLHNRATVRVVVPAGDGSGTPDAESKAVKIRNRAHEIAGAEKIPFGVAFRRAEREVIGQ
jgi:phage I-like protein